jgi:hypothetical protein
LLIRWLDDTRTIWLASAFSIALGLIFVFVWSPLPWGWLGIDHYHDRALLLAEGQPFNTTDVPWGYAYYLAAFYWLFGPHPWIPIVFQVLLNGLVPWLLYRLAIRLTDQRTAVLAAVLAGIFSFNTVYASTQSTDSVCTVLFLLSLWSFAEGDFRQRTWLFAASGMLAGLAAQFRPNLILFPFVAAALYVAFSRDRRRAIARGLLYVALMALALAPWVIRNYRLTGTFVPTSTHGGVQLWYGSLQTGDYLEDRMENPLSAFEAPAFDYTSLSDTPVLIEAAIPSCGDWSARRVQLVYWTNRNRQHRTLDPESRQGDRLFFAIPTVPDHTTVRFYFLATGPADDPITSPSDGAQYPHVVFVSTDHLGDLDRDDDFIDVFDLVRQVQARATGDARVTEVMVSETLAALVRAGGRELTPQFVTIAPGADATVLSFRGGSTLEIPHDTRVVSDLVPRGALARSVVHSRVRRAPVDNAHPCRRLTYIGANTVFYRKELHSQRRYTALALDNIRRAPLDYAASALYRAFRLFVIRGSMNINATQQFSGSPTVYAVGAVLSALYLVACLAGVAIAMRRSRKALVLLVPIIYVPVTISWVLTNMRYTITVQPYLFVFVALAVSTLLADRESRRVQAPAP